MSVYVNRVLNMKHIKVIGFDMDHTLVRYYTEAFERLVFDITIGKLVKTFNYPEEIQGFEFDFRRTIRGLVLDEEKGNLLKLSCYSKIKTAFHGTKHLNYRKTRRIYASQSVDLGEDSYKALDTSFSIAHALIFMQMVDLKDKLGDDEVLGPYSTLNRDIKAAIDIAHRDGSLKGEVIKNLSKYVKSDERIPTILEQFRQYDKKLWIVTNSDYPYTKALLDYTINPHLKSHEKWEDVFEVTVTLAAKPRYFMDDMPLLRIKDDKGAMENVNDEVGPGIYQGGNALQFQNAFGYDGSEILYLGDHIYGDIVKLKKACDWRTALVVDELDKEVEAYQKAGPVSEAIEKLMEAKVVIEKEIDDLYALQIEKGENHKEKVNELFANIETLDKELAGHIKSYEGHFNKHWGEVMRAGVEPSFFASQVERYACIYMSSITDLANFGPRTYFRPKKRKLAHEL